MNKYFFIYNNYIKKYNLLVLIFVNFNELQLTNKKNYILNFKNFMSFYFLLFLLIIVLNLLYYII